MLWFPVLHQWTLSGLCIWILPTGSQLPMHPSCIGNSICCVVDHHPKQFPRQVPDYIDVICNLDFYVNDTTNVISRHIFVHLNQYGRPNIGSKLFKVF